MYKKSINIALLLVITLFAITFILAPATTVSLNSPAANSVIGAGNTTLNVSIAISVGSPTSYNCTFSVGSPSTANSSGTFIITNITNNSNSGSVTLAIVNTSFSFNHTIIEDSNDYTFTAECTNGTLAVVSDTNTGITIDNTVPESATSLTSGTQSSSSVTVSGTVVGVNTTGCTLNFLGTNPGRASYTMTHSANSCTQALTGVADSTYHYYITTSDNTNTSNTGDTAFQVDTGNYGANPSKTTIVQKDGQFLGGDNTLWIIIIVVLIVASIIYILNK